MYNPKSAKSYILVIIQVAAITAIALLGKTFKYDLINIILSTLFIIPGLWAIIIMNKNFAVVSDVKETAKLIVKGPYKLIRHPMYTTVLTLTGLWIYNEVTVVRIIVWIILLTDLLYKLNYEEKLLADKFPDYSEYKKKTKKLIPFIY